MSKSAHAKSTSSSQGSNPEVSHSFIRGFTLATVIKLTTLSRKAGADWAMGTAAEQPLADDWLSMFSLSWDGATFTNAVGCCDWSPFTEHSALPDDTRFRMKLEMSLSPLTVCCCWLSSFVNVIPTPRMSRAGIAFPSNVCIAFSMWWVSREMAAALLTKWLRDELLCRWSTIPWPPYFAGSIGASLLRTRTWSKRNDFH